MPFHCANSINQTALTTLINKKNILSSYGKEVEQRKDIRLDGWRIDKKEYIVRKRSRSIPCYYCDWVRSGENYSGLKALSVYGYMWRGSGSVLVALAIETEVASDQNRQVAQVAKLNSFCGSLTHRLTAVKYVLPYLFLLFIYFSSSGI